MGALALAFMVLPVLSLAWRAPWSRFGSELAKPEVRDALRLSLVSSFVSTFLAVLLGLPLAWILARAQFPGRRLLRAVCVLPLLMPPVASGVALLLAYGRNGTVGRSLGRIGVHLPFSTPGVILAVTFVVLPYVVLTSESALRTADVRFEDAAATLGATRSVRFRRITLPLVAPSVLGGAALAWARALGEFGASITFAGNLPGRTQTMPIAIFLALENDPPAAIVLSLILIGVCLATLLLLRDRVLV